MSTLQSQRLAALRAAHGPRMAASRAAFERELLEAEAARAAQAQISETLAPVEIVAKLMAQGGPPRTDAKGSNHAEEADQQG